MRIIMKLRAPELQRKVDQYNIMMRILLQEFVSVFIFCYDGYVSLSVFFRIFHTKVLVPFYVRHSKECKHINIILFFLSHILK